LVFGLVRTFNLLLLAQLVFAACAVYCLALHVTRDRLSAFVGGVAFAFAPSVLSPLHNGTSAGGNVGWIAFYLLVLLRSGALSTRRAAVVGGLLALVTHMCWYYGAFCVLATVLYLAPIALRAGAGARKRQWGGLALVLIVAALLVMPLGVLIKATLVHPDAQHLGGKETFISQALDHEFYASTIRGFFDMSARRPVDGYAHPCYLGLAVLLLAGFGLYRGRRGGATWQQRYWVLLAVVFALLSLGPVLWVEGRAMLLLPYYVAMKWVPFFHYFEFPFRFTVLTHLALAVLAACGLRALLNGRPAWQRMLLTVLVSGVILAEYLAAIAWPLPSSDARVPHVYAELAALPGEGGVLDLPLDVGTTGRYLYYQVAHKRPVPVGINRLGSKDLESILAPGAGSDPWHWIVEDLDVAQLAALRGLGIRFIVCHQDPSGAGGALGDALEARGLRVILRDASRRVFDLTDTVPMAI
jgi:hypothetical protein